MYLSVTSQFRNTVLGTEVVPQQLAGDARAHLAPVLQRMIEVKSGIYPGLEDFVQKVSRILKRVGVDTILERYAVHDEMNIGGAEVVRNQRRYCARDTAMCGRVFGTIRRAAQGKPAGSRRQFAIAAAGGNGPATQA